MIRFLLIAVAIATSSCKPNPTQKFEVLASIDSNQNATAQEETDSIILYEDRIKGVPLPFPAREMLADLTREFTWLQVTKETGQQDGPDLSIVLNSRQP
jgi:hypothetical protein